MNKNIKKLKFTLIEVTVAFGVLAILIMFLMQFLTTAQTSWSFAEKRARAYADSRTFFDIVEKVIQSQGQKDFTPDETTYNEFSVFAVKPFSDNLYQNVNVKFYDDDSSDEDDKGTVKIGEKIAVGNVRNEEIIINNVVSFYINKDDTRKIIVMVLKMFGTEADYAEWLSLSETPATGETKSPREKYFETHGFIFPRIINSVE